MIRAIDAALDALQDSRKKGAMKMEDLFEDSTLLGTKTKHGIDGARRKRF